MKVYCNECKGYSEVFYFFRERDIYDIPNTIRGYKSNIEQCPTCGSQIMMGSYIINNNIIFDEEISIKIGEILSKEIAGCENCDSAIIPSTQKYGDPDDQTLVYDLVEGDTGLPPNITKNVYNHIHCSNSTCMEELNSDDPYVTSSDLELWYQEEIDIVVKTFDITESEGIQFIDFLIKNPMLGLHHPIGQKIFEMIKDKKIPGIKEVKSGEKLYRGRKKNNLERLAIYIPEELWNPPEGIPGQGRYNPPGISSLYLANNHNIILKELDLEIEEESVDIAEFLILEDMSVWDARDLDIDIFSSIPSFNNKLVLKQEYIFPNFIAQCLMANNYKGIIYKSTRGDGSNYCLFNFKRDRDLVITKVDPFDSFSDAIQRKPLFKSILPF